MRKSCSGWWFGRLAKHCFRPSRTSIQLLRCFSPHGWIPYQQLECHLSLSPLPHCCQLSRRGSFKRVRLPRPFYMPRPKDSWVFWGSALGLIEEAVEFAAGRIEGALLLFRAVVDQWAAVGPNHIMNKFLGRDLS